MGETSRNEIVERVRLALSEGLQGADVAVSRDRSARKVSGRVIWDGFGTADLLDRQRQVRDVLRDRLGVDARWVSVVLTYTPREYALMTAE